MRGNYTNRGLGTHTEIRERGQIQMGKYTERRLNGEERGNTVVEGTYTEREETRRGDTHWRGDYMKRRGKTRRGDIHAERI